MLGLFLTVQRYLESPLKKKLEHPCTFGDISTRNCDNESEQPIYHASQAQPHGFVVSLPLFAVFFLPEHHILFLASHTNLIKTPINVKLLNEH